MTLLNEYGTVNHVEFCLLMSAPRYHLLKAGSETKSKFMQKGPKHSSTSLPKIPEFNLNQAKKKSDPQGSGHMSNLFPFCNNASC